MKIMIINGPNLNLLGKREPEIYGGASMGYWLEKWQLDYAEEATIDYYQSNIEGELINKLHEVGFSYDSIILNAGAYTHTSIALLDAIRAIQTPVIEVHISNVNDREEFRRHSMIASACAGTIQGFGMKSYQIAIEAVLSDNRERIRQQEEEIVPF